MIIEHFRRAPMFYTAFGIVLAASVACTALVVKIAIEAAQQPAGELMPGMVEVTFASLALWFVAGQIYDRTPRGTPDMSGADLANLVNESALFAARRGKRFVDMEDFEAAKDKIMMSAERRSMIMPEEERRNTAYHESGHAVVTKLMPKTDTVHKVTIIPRGRALGLNMQLQHRQGSHPVHDRGAVRRSYRGRDIHAPDDHRCFQRLRKRHRYYKDGHAVGYV